MELNYITWWHIYELPLFLGYIINNYLDLNMIKLVCMNWRTAIDSFIKKADRQRKSNQILGTENYSPTER